MIVHAGLVARRSRGEWRGALLRGPSGAGKSDLALRLMATGWRLTADDRVVLWTQAGRLFGRGPDALHGLIELRSLGVMVAPALPFCEVVLVVEADSDPDRCPAPRAETLAGVTLSTVVLNLLEPSAVPKLARAFHYAARKTGDAGSQLGEYQP